MNDESTPDAARAILSDLRWGVDCLITNYEGERVWLKRAYSPDGRAGITDCCPEESPCEHHAAIAARRRVKDI